jgi:hypothetical protein
MKHLRTYKSINESTLGELSFEDFKDILIDIADLGDEYKFNNTYGYSLVIYLNIDRMLLDPTDRFNYLKEISDYNRPIDLNDMTFEKIKDSISNRISYYESKIKLIIEVNKKLLDIIKRLEDSVNILKKFKHHGISISFDSNLVCLEFFM